MKCPLCQTNMILKQYFVPISRNVTGGTIYLPSEASIDIFPWDNTSSYYYWECPKCRNVEIDKTHSALPQLPTVSEIDI